VKLSDKLLIILACILSVATSTSGVAIRLVPGTYQVNSDCLGSEKSGQLQITYADRLILKDGTNFGFPSNKIDYKTDGTPFTFPSGLVTTEKGENVKIYVSDDTRTCRGLTWDKDDGSMLFICEESGTVVCTIYLERIGPDTSTSSNTST
jgi:hypothetical protein